MKKKAAEKANKTKSNKLSSVAVALAATKQREKANKPKAKIVDL